MEHGCGFSSWVSGFGVRLFWLNFTFHDLRHKAISRMFEKGLNVPEFYQSVVVRRPVNCLGMCRSIFKFEIQTNALIYGIILITVAI